MTNKIVQWSKKADIDIAATFVDTLFEDRRALLLGMVLQAVIICSMWIESGLAVFGVLAVLAVMFSSLRIILTGYYLAEKPRYAGEPTMSLLHWARKWERYYGISVILTALNVGAAAYFGLHVVHTRFSDVASLVLMFASLPSVIGRLYGSRPIAMGVFACVLAPTTIGAVINGSPFYSAVSLLLIPYMGMLYAILSGVREPVARAVRSRYEVAELADQFDIALNNMKHGLFMFDSQLRVMVANDRAHELFGVPQDVNLEGRSLETLLRYGRRSHGLSQRKARKLQRVLQKLLAAGGSNVEFQRDNNSYLELSAKVRDDGASILVIEEVTERVHAKRELEKMARFDGLTGLANREHFAKTVNNRLQAAKQPSWTALIVLDVDDFKFVNDTIGHHYGDLLLRAVADRIQSASSKNMLLARHGGDEFMIYIDNLATADEIVEIVERFKNELQGRYVLGSEMLDVNISLGAYCATAGAFELDDAMVRADIALYKTKSDGKAGWTIFESSMEEQYRRRERLKTELFKAVHQQALKIVYQPIVGLQDGRMTACEALSRWEHPQLGSIPPSEFIPLAEEMGIISKVTESVIWNACHACAEWPENISVSVNLSALDFRTGRISGIITEALEKSRLDPARLEIEITESVAVRNEAVLRETLQELRAIGVKISLDDFGTGYSNLSHLDRLPLDTIKIDRSFVTDICGKPDRARFLGAVLNLCATLQRKVTIEGIETVEQLQLIIEMGGSHRIQGFVFGGSLSAEAIGELAAHQYFRPDQSARSRIALVSSS